MGAKGRWDLYNGRIAFRYFRDLCAPRCLQSSFGFVLVHLVLGHFFFSSDFEVHLLLPAVPFAMQTVIGISH